VAHSIDMVTAGRRAIEIGLGGGGGVERRAGEGVAWLSVAQGGGETLGLAQDLAEAVIPVEVGDPRGPRRSPSAHVTVARHAPAALIRDPSFRQPPDPPIGWRAERVVLFRSVLERHGARYEVLHVARLTGS
jgi:2'-5' RNA ligase